MGWTVTCAVAAMISLRRRIARAAPPPLRRAVAPHRMAGRARAWEGAWRAFLAARAAPRSAVRSGATTRGFCGGGGEDAGSSRKRGRRAASVDPTVLDPQLGPPARWRAGSRPLARSSASCPFARPPPGSPCPSAPPCLRAFPHAHTRTHTRTHTHHHHPSPHRAHRPPATGSFAGCSEAPRRRSRRPRRRPECSTCAGCRPGPRSPSGPNSRPWERRGGERGTGGIVGAQGRVRGVWVARGGDGSERRPGGEAGLPCARRGAARPSPCAAPRRRPRPPAP